MAVKALVTGAAGAVGLLLVQALLDRGYHVRALVRTAPNQAFPPAVEVCLGDIRDKDAVGRAVAACDVIFHLAAKLHINNPNSKFYGEYRETNVEGTRNLVTAAAMKRFVYFSTIAVYDSTSADQIRTEADVANPRSIYGQTKLEGEQTVLAARSAVDQKPCGVVLRMAAIYGSHMKGNYPRLIKALRGRWFVPVGNGYNRRTLIHEQDAVAAAILAAEHPAAVGQVFNVSDGQVHSMNSILAAIANALGRRPPRLFIPAFIAWSGVSVIELLFKLGGRNAPVGRSTVEKFTEDIAVSGSKIQEVLGFRSRFDLESGWREATLRVDSRMTNLE